MRFQKQITVFLAISVLCVMSINIYYLFFYRANKMIPEELLQKEMHDYVMDPEEPMTVPVGESITEPDSLVYVRDIPLPLDEAMDTHLKRFRAEAQALRQRFPHAFFISGPTEEKLVALTFDDGPDKEVTSKIAAILDNYQIPATFFFIGQDLQKNSAAVGSVLSGGHLIANHSWSHPRPLEISDETLMDEVRQTQKELEALGITTKLFRPPYGLVSTEQMVRLEEEGYKVFAWSVDSMDWHFKSPEEIIQCVLERVHPGSVILFHSAAAQRETTVHALPQIIEALQRQGYRFVTVDALVGD